ncbi:hypothetical protein JL12_00930 [Gallibacterium anatis 10672-6]|uniref:glycosyltransferase family 4 protein n=1 Tax=Gallibacterium anatis TaxID=750 RepID=UPI0005310BDA|nr:glycosyltransferase family 4 protein [Gallibacterium anatis]KGQ52462.1 hypothetical protein JL12_00930 [Gallibacterium anatis 10672-6]
MSNVLIVSPSFPYPEYKDGIKKVNYNLLIGRANYTVDLLCIGDEKIIPIKDINIYDIPFSDDLTKKDYLLKWLVSSNPFNVIKYKNYIKLLAEKLLEIHKSYDILHISSPFLAPLIDFLPDDIKNKMILFPLDSISLFFERRSDKEENFIKKLVYKLELYKCKKFEYKYYEKYRLVCFVSDVDSLYIRRLNQNINTEFIPNGVNTEFFKKDDGVNIENNSIIFTGNMAYGPNEDAAIFLIEKVYPLITKVINIKLYIVGQSPTKRIKRYNSNNIIVTGFVDDLRDYINKASVYISPLRYGSGIKNKVLEAMSMSKIVIGTDVSFDTLEVYDNENCIKISYNEREIASKIIDVLKNMNKYKFIGINARALIEKKYSWDAICLQYNNLYNEYLLKKK